MQRLFRGHVQRSELAGHRRAATMVQAYIRRCQAILNTRETRQKLAKENGVLVACKGTIQGHSGWYHQEEDGEKYYFTVENDTVCDPLITDERCWKRLLISSMFNQNSWGLVCGPVECQTWVTFMKQVRLGRFVARWHSNAHHRCPGRGKHGRITGSAWHGGREVGLLQQQQAAGRSC